ncbi:MAG: histidine kinase N-terminal 7TM domain-containing protein, partial [Patescibacteria group bacterium]
MEVFANIRLASLIITVAVNFILVWIVNRSSPKSATNISYGILGFLISFWLTVLYIAQDLKFSEAGLLWARLTIVIAAPMSMMFLILSHTIPNEKLQFKRRIFVTIIIVTTLVSIINFSRYAIIGLDIKDGSSNPITGVGMLPFGILSTFFSLGAIYFLIKKFRNSSEVIKRQIKVVLLGIMIMLSLVISTILLPVVIFQNDFFVRLAPVYTLAFLGATAYAIVKYQLFNIKVIIT